MISSLDDAWRWYESVREITLAMKALADKHWEGLPWDGPLGRDERLRHLYAPEVSGWAAVARGDLDDLGVLLLFSVFEANVRERVLAEVAGEVRAIRHPALLHAVRGFSEALEHGSFFRVTEAYKALDPDLTEQVNQVRRYRNWVAHGRRGPALAAIEPATAYGRLRRFLNLLDSAPASSPGA